MEERKYYPGMRLYTYNPKLFDALDDLKEAIRDNDLGKAEKKLAVLEAILFKMSYQVDTKIDVLQYSFGARAEKWQKLYDTLTGIQMGTIQGPEGWVVEVK